MMILSRLRCGTKSDFFGSGYDPGASAFPCSQKLLDRLSTPIGHVVGRKCGLLKPFRSLHQQVLSLPVQRSFSNMVDSKPRHNEECASESEKGEVLIWDGREGDKVGAGKEGNERGFCCTEGITSPAVREVHVIMLHLKPHSL